MAQVYVEPQKLREFAKRLKNFSQTAEQNLKALKSEMARLGTTWRDQEFGRFVQQFSAVEKFLMTFSKEIENTVPKLEKDAATIEESQRLKVSI